MNANAQKQIKFEQMVLANHEKERRAYHAAIPSHLAQIVSVINDNQHVQHENWEKTVDRIRDDFLVLRRQSKRPFEQYDETETRAALQDVIMMFNSFAGLTNGRLELRKRNNPRFYGAAAYVEKFELVYIKN